MENKTKWTEADFDDWSWHDAQIKSISLDQEEEFQNDLVLDLDFILEWICRENQLFHFQMAPAELRFSRVHNLNLSFKLTFKEALVINSIERFGIIDKGFKTFHWIIKLHHILENRIEFDASSCIQVLTGVPVETDEQHLSKVQRQQSIQALRTLK